MKNSDNLIHSFNHTPDTEGNFQGLTKREYFAGLAMAAMVNRDKAKSGWSDSESDQAIYIADSLLKQLEK